MATSEKALAPILVKRVKKGGHAHHGGVWKIAYADFVTAMMAFFLLMWVLGSTTAGDLAGISAYFKNPLRIAIRGGAGSGDTTRIVKGGGDSVFHKTGQEARADTSNPQRRAASSEQEISEEYNRIEQAKLEKLREALTKQISSDASLDKFKNQIFMDITADGLRIQIVDENNRPMFESGSADMSAASARLLRTIGKVLSTLPNRLRIEGHTDSRPFGSERAAYGNWELSSDRANAARRAVIGGGMEAARVALVAGFADSVQLNPADPNDPLNRRISLMVLKQALAAAAAPSSAAAASSPAVLPVAPGAPLGGAAVMPPIGGALGASKAVGGAGAALTPPAEAKPASDEAARAPMTPPLVPAAPSTDAPRAGKQEAVASGSQQPQRGQAFVLPPRR